VDKDREVAESQTKTGFFGVQTKWLRVVGLFLWGFKLVAVCGIGIMAYTLELYHVKNQLIYLFALIILSIGMLFILLLLIFELYRGFVLSWLCKDSTFAKEIFSLFAVGVCFAVLGILHKQNLAPIVIGSLSAIYFIGERNAYKCSYPWVAFGCFLSGAFTQLIPWPSMMRIFLVLFGVGISATLQGAWIIFRNLPWHLHISPFEIDNSGKIQMPHTLEEMQIREDDISLDRILSWFSRFRKT
jgi:hypothetical protein